MARPPPGLSFGIHTPRNLILQGGQVRSEVPPPLRGGNHQRRKDLSGGQISPGRTPPGGEIVLIVMSIIKIIITIIPNTSTISIFTSTHFTIAICVVPCTIHPLYFTGVDYYFVVNAIEFCWRNIIVSRLFIIYLSTLIMISLMSCE